jgi:hypothetical protein
LFSVKQLVQARGKFCLEGTKAYLYNSCNQLIATCGLEQDLYILGKSLRHHDLDVQPTIQNHFQTIPCPKAMLSKVEESTLTWHQLPKHISFNCLKELIRSQMVKGINLINITKIPFYESYVMGKQ